MVKAEFELNWAEKQRNTLGKDSKNNDILSDRININRYNFSINPNCANFSIVTG